MSLDTIFNDLHQRGLDFNAPALLWALLLVPALVVFYAGALRARRRVASAFRVKRAGLAAPHRPRRVWRAMALALLLLGLAGLVVGFARPEVPLDTPNDRATVVVIVDASTAMRATDVSPTRFEAAKAAAQTAIKALPDRLQVAVVGYSREAYILVPPTHDHGAAIAALARLRTAEDAAAGDSIAVALAALPLLQDQSAGGGTAAAGTGAGAGSGTTPGAGAGAGAVPGSAQGAAPAQATGPGGGQGAPKVPAAIVLVATGVNTVGRSLDEGIAAARDASIPVHVVPIVPRQGTEVKAPFDDNALRAVARGSGGRYLASPGTRDWRQVYDAIGSAVVVRLQPQEIGHFVGAASLGVIALSMLVSLWASRRLV
jgi:Ca-activated chloride channel family protein